MPTTILSGYLYDATGAVVKKGKVHLTLQQDMVSTDSTKVAPFTVSSDLSPIATPGAPTVTPVGTAGSTSYSYKIVAKDAAGNRTLPGTAGVTATGNATLSPSNFNRITWAAVPNAFTYEVYGRTNNNWQLIATGLTDPVAGFDDTGAVTPSGAVPVANTTGGFVYVVVYPTVGATPAGLAYYVEFDPDPLDLSKPNRNKNGYWSNYWAVPNTTPGPIPIGQFSNALRGNTSANYVGVGAEVVTLGTPTYFGATPSATTKRLLANQTSGSNPEIRYNTSSSLWEVSHNGSSFERIGSLSGSGYFAQGGNTFGASATLGLNDNFDLNIKTNNIVRMTIAGGGTTSFSGVVTMGQTLAVTGNTTVGGTLGVTGLSTLSGGATISGTTSMVNATTSGTFGVTGLATFSGGAQFADTVIQRPEFRDYSETTTQTGVTGSITINFETANIHRLTLNGNTTVTAFSNPPATGKAGTLTVVVTQDGTGGRTISWPASVVWAGALAPTMTSGASKTDVYQFITFNAGTTWYGFVGGQNF